MSRRYEESELILNQDGSIFHLHLKPEHVAETVILVGDPDRVDMIGEFFSKILFRVRNREFYTITGYYREKLLTVISTGIGTDNIDIVVNELDALINIDLQSRTDLPVKKQLNLLRIGTSGAIQEDIEPGTYMASQFALGFDGLLNFYKERQRVCHHEMERAFIKHTGWDSRLSAPYFCECANGLLGSFSKYTRRGITVSANGFYGPQGRDLRARLAFPDLNRKMSDFEYNSLRITNFEMEGSAIYGLSKILGHQALTICLIIANRERKLFLRNYKPAMKNLIEICLNTLTNPEDS